MRNMPAGIRAARQMGNPTATLERANKTAMNVPASQLAASDKDSAERPRAGGIKFTYPSGSRPLEGYTIKRGVGRGGFGEVYFATSDAGKEVALKLIRRNLEVELRGVTQCLNLKHPNLVGVYDIRSDGMDDQWVIMEFVSGESLEDVIDRHPTGVPIDQVLGWMRGICAGVAYLHDHGIVHRDLKPGNIFLDEGTVKIGDYGLAKFISCSRRSGQTESVGTVHYMAPEIANGRYGREIDTYALGIILFEMLTGTVPFEGESVGEVLMKHLTAEPDLHRLQEPYREIVQRALAKDPDTRLKTVHDLVAMLPGDNGSAVGFTPSSVSDVVLVSAAQAKTHQNDAAAGNGAAKPFGVAVKPVSPAAGAPPNVAANEVEEPLWKAVRDTWQKFWLSWHGEGPHAIKPLAKALIMFALVMGAIQFGGELMALVVPVLICYGIYYVIWASVIRPGIMRHSAQHGATAATPTAADSPQRPEAMTAAWSPPGGGQPATPASRYAEKARRRRMRVSWRERAHRDLAAMPLRDKLSELLGSMLAAAVFASLAALVAPALLGVSANSNGMAIYLWLALVGTLGSWAVMVPTKFSEGRVEDQVPIRMLMLVLGGLVGAVAWLLAEGLIVHIPRSREPLDASWGMISHEMLGWNAPQNGAIPSLAMFVTYFAFLFVLVRWWRQAEFTRNQRLSPWSIVICVFWAWLLQFFWEFPQPTGMLVAGVIAFATQLASPWLPPSRRRALSDDAEQTV
jgi:eukaryotic-like serine/threonine-protein kinase